MMVWHITYIYPWGWTFTWSEGLFDRRASTPGHCVWRTCGPWTLLPLQISAMHGYRQCESNLNRLGVALRQCNDRRRRGVHDDTQRRIAHTLSMNTLFDRVCLKCQVRFLVTCQNGLASCSFEHHKIHQIQISSDAEPRREAVPRCAPVLLRQHTHSAVETIHQISTQAP